MSSIGLFVELWQNRRGTIEDFGRLPINNYDVGGWQRGGVGLLKIFVLFVCLAALRGFCE